MNFSIYDEESILFKSLASSNFLDGTCFNYVLVVNFLFNELIVLLLANVLTYIFFSVFLLICKC